MDVPIAFGLQNSEPFQAFRVNIDPSKFSGSTKERAKAGPAVIIAKNAAVLIEMKGGLLNASDVLAVHEGDWSEAIVVIMPTSKSAASEVSAQLKGDQEFLNSVRENAPALFELASQTLAAIRAAGVEGDLKEGTAGRWINRPINTFTLKAQPRAENIHFTLYGNPETYEQSDFLLADQNSYSRGWVRNVHDAKVLAQLAQQSHSRRQK